ncbi:hypothetical protein DFH09DRAFT_1293844, partial [Mycena vulgaris]
MPSDVWGVKHAMWRRETQMYLLRPIQRSDWDRVFFYSSRIREFTVCHESQTVWELARPSIPPGASLLPNIQHLHWAMNVGLSTIPKFLGPNVVSLDLQIYTWQLSTLAALAPILSSPIQLKIQGIQLMNYESLLWEHQDFVQQASLFIRGLNMTRLEVTNLDASALLYISQLPLLISLILRPSFTCPCIFPPFSFPALRILELACNRNPNDRETTLYPATCNSDLLISFIKACDNWKLESISIDCAPTPAILEAIHAHCAHTLMRLEIGFGVAHYAHTKISTESVDSMRLPSSMIQPLLSFTRLRALSLKSPVGIDLDTPTFLQMASAWPDLES